MRPCHGNWREALGGPFVFLGGNGDSTLMDVVVDSPISLRK